MPLVDISMSSADRDHILDRHGPQGSADSNFSSDFLWRNGPIRRIAQLVADHGDYYDDIDNSGRDIRIYYLNFRDITGYGYDQYQYKVDFKGVQMVGTMSGNVFYVETMYPKGYFKDNDLYDRPVFHTKPPEHPQTPYSPNSPTS